MAKVIVAWCDPHMANDEQVPGTSFVFSINEGKPIEIDLCEQHEKEFISPLMELLEDSGQPVVLEQKSVGPGGPKRPCGQCGKELTREGMRKHYMTHHGMERPAAGDAVREIFGSVHGRPAVRRCPECGDEFDTPQGMGAHRRSVHNVAGAQSKPAAPASA